jgi:hypothetical protein
MVKVISNGHTIFPLPNISIIMEEEVREGIFPERT